MTVTKHTPYCGIHAAYPGWPHVYEAGGWTSYAARVSATRDGPDLPSLAGWQLSPTPISSEIPLLISS